MTEISAVMVHVTVDCSACDGRGFYVTSGSAGASLDDTEVDCDNCEGTGQVVPEDMEIES